MNGVSSVSSASQAYAAAAARRSGASAKPGQPASGAGDAVSWSGAALYRNSALASGYSAAVRSGSGIVASRLGEEPGGQTAAAFAADVMRRVGGLEEDTSRNETNAAALERSLTQTMEHISAAYGSKAATAAMTAVYKSVGNGPATEENLGQGLLRTIKLVDRNFGFAEGDKLMEHLNADLNVSLNTFFANGKNETFFAVDPARQMQVEMERVGQAAKGLAEGMSQLVGAIGEMSMVSGNAVVSDGVRKEWEKRLAEQLQRKMREAAVQSGLESYPMLASYQREDVDLNPGTGSYLDTTV